MGNTKYIWFEGDALPIHKSQFSEQALFDVCNASYVSVKVDEKGYLESNEGDPEDSIFVLGIIHSYSMKGLQVLEHLEKYLASGFGGYLDSDYESMQTFYFKNGKKTPVNWRAEWKV